MTHNGSSSDRYFYINSSLESDNGDLGTVTAPHNESLTTEHLAALGSTSFKKFFIEVSGAVAFSYIKVTYGEVTVSDYCTTIPVPVNDIVITSALWATYVPNQDVTIPEDVTAYIVTNATSTSVTLSSVASAPANTGPTAAEATDDVSDNLLVVSDGTVKGDGATIYALGNKGGTVGFKRVANDVTVPAGKPYLTIESNGSKDFFDFSFDEGVATGIESVESVGFDMNAPVYDLQGRQVNRLYKGIFIQNGKKIIVK